MSVFSGIAKVIAGAAAIAGGIALEGITFGGSTAISGLLISTGAGLALNGLGTLVNGSGSGRGSNVGSERNPIKAWPVGIGRFRTGGVPIYINQWPPPGGYGGPTGIFSIFGIGPQAQRNANVFLDLVFVVAAHQVQSIDAVLLDGTPLSLDPTAAFFGLQGPGKPTPTLGASSYNPTQTNKQSTSITRSNGVITVVCPFDIPSLDVGYPIILQDQNGQVGLTNTGLAGTYIVEQITHGPGAALTFTVLSGGPDIAIPNSGYPNPGWVTTNWAQYGRDVYVEYMLGDQTLGQTFNGLIGGTPFQGTGPYVGPNLNTQNIGINIGPGGSNPWNTYCSLQGKAVVFMRLYYEATIFSGGLPQISFLCHGKQDIYDPRLGACTGVKEVTLSSAGSGGYIFGDVLALTTGGGYATIMITGISSTASPSGTPSSWQVLTTGHGCSLGTSATSGGHGSGATFQINTLGGISAGIVGIGGDSGIGVETGGQNYNIADIIEIGGAYGNGSLGIAEVMATTSGGAVTYLILRQSGYGYSTAHGVPCSIVGNNLEAYLGIVGAFKNASGTGLTVNILAVVGGVNSTAVYSENSALVNADYMANTIWGYSATYVTPGSGVVPTNNIDITALTTSANVCDQTVTLAEGGTEPRYTCNGIFDLSKRRGDVLNDLLTSMAGRFLNIGGLYSFQPAYWVGTGSPAFQVNLASIAAGNPTWRSNVKIRELFNAVKGTYVNPSNKWEPSDFPYYAQDFLHGYNGPSQYGGDINLAVDLGQRRYKDIHLPFTISASMAQRIAKVELLRGRNQGGYGIGTGTFPLNMAGYQFIPLDVFEATFPYLSWSNKVLEVTAVRFRVDDRNKGAPALGVEIDVQETSSSPYDWSVDEELTPEGYQQAFSPASSVSQAVPFPWSPGGVAPLAGDALYPAGAAGLASFTMMAVYGAETGGVGTSNLQIGGQPPINSLNKELGMPFVTVYAIPTGGTLAPGTYVVGISAFDTDNNNLPYLDLATVVVGSGLGAATVSVSTPGVNYVVGQVVILQGGDNNCAIMITNTSGGTVTGVSVYFAGTGMSATTYTSLGGTGTGLNVTINTLTAATSTGSLTIIPAWGPGDNGGDIYMAMQTLNSTEMSLLAANDAMLAADVMHYQQTLSPGQASASITSFNQSTPGGPDPLFYNFGVAWQEVVHSGPWTEQVQAVDATHVTIFGPGMTLNQWTGYTLTLLAHYDPTVPVEILNMPIASSTASSNVNGLADVDVFTSGTGGYHVADVLAIAGGTGGQVTVNGVDGSGNITAWAITASGHGYTTGIKGTSGGSGSGAQFTVNGLTAGTFVLVIGPNSASVQLPDLTTLLSVGDLVGVLLNPTFTASSYTDANIANGFYPNGDTGVEKGNLIKVMTGVDAGDVQVVANVANSSGPITSLNPATSGNPATIVNLAGTWQTTPNSGDVVIVLSPQTYPEFGTGTFTTPNKSGGVVTIATPITPNLLGRVWLFTVRTQDVKGNTAPDFCAPSRMVYLFGATGVRLVTAGTYSMLPWDGEVECDCSGGDVIYNCLPASQVPNQTFTLVKIDASPNTVTINMASGDTFADGSIVKVLGSKGQESQFRYDEG